MEKRNQSKGQGNSLSKSIVSQNTQQLPKNLSSSVVFKNDERSSGLHQNHIRDQRISQNHNKRATKVINELSPALSAKIKQFYETTYEADFGWRRQIKRDDEELNIEGVDAGGFKQIERTKMGVTNSIEIATPYRDNWKALGKKNV